jgi:hypothetical protein
VPLARLYFDKSVTDLPGNTKFVTDIQKRCCSLFPSAPDHFIDVSGTFAVCRSTNVPLPLEVTRPRSDLGCTAPRRRHRKKAVA